MINTARTVLTNRLPVSHHDIDILKATTVINTHTAGNYRLIHTASHYDDRLHLTFKEIPIRKQHAYKTPALARTLRVEIHISDVIGNTKVEADRGRHIYI